MSFQVVNGKNKSDSLILRPFGFGIQVDQFNYLNAMIYDDLLYYPSNSSFLISFNLSNHFRIEPELGYYTVNDSTDNSKYSTLRYGLSMSGMYQKGNVNFYFGGRVNAGSLKEVLYPYQGSSNPTTTNTISIFEFGPIMGAEYYINPHFSVGVNLGYVFNSSSIKSDYPSSTDKSITYSATTTGFLVRFYY